MVENGGVCVFNYRGVNRILIDWLWWGETDISELQPIVYPRVNVSGELWWWWCWLGITPDLSTRAHWQLYQQRHLKRVGGMDEGMRILRIQYLWYVSRFFTCRKVLQHGASGFTCHLKVGVLWIFIALKNPSPRPGLNPWPLGPVASTLTTTPPRQQTEHQNAAAVNLSGNSEVLIKVKSMKINGYM
jgi:hypothetical protein